MATVIDAIVEAATMPAASTEKRDAAVAAMMARVWISPVGIGINAGRMFMLRAEGCDAVMIDADGNIFDVVERKARAA